MVPSFITSNQTDPGGSLTREAFDKGIAQLEARDAWERAHPHGLDAENPHIVGPRTAERLRRWGGYAMCGTCGLFYQPPQPPPQ